MFKFFKKNKDNAPKKNYNLEYDNLALPEIKIHKNHDKINDNDNTHESNNETNNDEAHNKKTDVTYDSVAIPEVHIRKKN